MMMYPAMQAETLRLRFFHQVQGLLNAGLSQAEVVPGKAQAS